MSGPNANSDPRADNVAQDSPDSLPEQGKRGFDPFEVTSKLKLVPALREVVNQLVAEIPSDLPNLDTSDLQEFTEMLLESVEAAVDGAQMNTTNGTPHSYEYARALHLEAVRLREEAEQDEEEYPSQDELVNKLYQLGRRMGQVASELKLDKED